MVTWMYRRKQQYIGKEENKEDGGKKSKNGGMGKKLEKGENKDTTVKI